VSSDEVRYVYEHSILPYSADGSRGLRSGHRVSIMIRVSHTSGVVGDAEESRTRRRDLRCPLDTEVILKRYPACIRLCIQPYPYP
jgi:hypothetical protein